MFKRESFKVPGTSLTLLERLFTILSVSKLYIVMLTLKWKIEWFLNYSLVYGGGEELGESGLYASSLIYAYIETLNWGLKFGS